MASGVFPIYNHGHEWCQLVINSNNATISSDSVLVKYDRFVDISLYLCIKTTGTNIKIGNLPTGNMHWAPTATWQLSCDYKYNNSDGSDAELWITADGEVFANNPANNANKYLKISGSWICRCAYSKL